MHVFASKSFVKMFKKRIPKGSKLEKQVRTRIELFVKDHRNPILKDHTLKGKLYSYRAFSVAGDLRILYYQSKENGRKVAVFIDIGSHNQLYK